MNTVGETHCEDRRLKYYVCGFWLQITCRAFDEVPPNEFQLRLTHHAQVVSLVYI